MPLPLACRDCVGEQASLVAHAAASELFHSAHKRIRQRDRERGVKRIAVASVHEAVRRIRKGVALAKGIEVAVRPQVIGAGFVRTPKQQRLATEPQQPLGARSRGRISRESPRGADRNTKTTMAWQKMSFARTSVCARGRFPPSDRTPNISTRPKLGKRFGSATQR